MSPVDGGDIEEEMSRAVTRRQHFVTAARDVTTRVISPRDCGRWRLRIVRAQEEGNPG